MKSNVRNIFSILMVVVMAVSLTACGEDTGLESRTTNGVTLNVPSDLGAFAASSGVQVASDKASTSAIAISEKADGQGATASDYEQDTYQEAYMGNYKDITFEKFDNNAQLDGKSALLAQFKATNSKDAKITVCNYIVFFEDGTFQSISLNYVDGRDSSVEKNFDSIINSIKMG